MIRDIDLSVFVRLGDKIAGPLKNTEKMVADAADRMNRRLKLSLKLGAVGAASGGVAFGVQQMVTGLTDSIRQVEKAKGELATLGVKDLDAVVRRGQQMQMQLAGVTADAFVRASYDIKSGISTLTDQGVADMTASAMVTAKATKAQAEQMTSLYATSYGIFKKQFNDLNDAEFGDAFGAMLAKSVQAFKTDGSQMQQAIESAGAGAVNLGMTMREQLALLGMMQQQMAAGEAGTALRAFATNAAAAEEAFADLAKGAGGNPIRVRVLDEKGGLRSIADVMADLKARYGETLDAIEAAEIKKAFGTDEAMKMINALYGQEAAIRANAEALGDAGRQGAAFTAEMAKAADANWDSAMVLMSQKMDVFRQKLGGALLPVLQKLLPVIDGMIDRVVAWADANPDLLAGIGAAVVGFGAVAAVLSPVLLGLGSLVGTWAVASYGATRLALALRRLGPAFRLVTQAILWMGRALLANPIGIAVAAVAGAAYLIYRNWEPISAWFSRLWGNIRDIFSGFSQFLSGIFSGDLGGAVDGLKRAWEGLKGYYQTLWNGIEGIFRWAWENGIKPVTDALGVTDAIVAGWNAARDGIGAALDWIREKFAQAWALISPIIDGLKWVSDHGNAAMNSITGANKDPISSGPYTGGATGPVVPGTAVPGVNFPANPTKRAQGGSFFPGPLVVGERGAELRYESRGGFIAHNNALRGLVAMSERARALGRMVMGSDAGQAWAGQPIPATAIAPGTRARQISHQPQYNIVINGSGLDAAQLRAAVRTELQAASRRAAADLRGMLHD